VRTFHFKYSWVCAGAFVSVLAACSAAVHPFGALKEAHSQKSSIDGFPLSPQITAVLKRSCLDCHSNQTVWPWYSYVAPASWLIEKDVRRGRDHMNLSQWQRYTFEKKAKLLADIATVVKNGEMPLRPYTLVHRQAKLSEADADMLYHWARGERRKLKVASQLTSRP
jgi:hypothetical protein